MPSGKMKEGATGYVRVTVLQMCGDYFQVRVEGKLMTLTQWVPADECALFEDINDLPPPRHANYQHLDR